jgi:hypothetical protein
MHASESRTQANRRNSAGSPGPKTAESQEKSRQEALKQGMTGAGVVWPVEHEAEVERRFAAFRAELQPSGLVGLTLVRRAATLSVRMEQCSEREMAASAERVGRAMVELEIPEGVDQAEAARLRASAGRLAAFDTSREGAQARRYEAAAERGFYRALKELRLVEKQPKPAEPTDEVESFRKVLGSFCEMRKEDEEFNAAYPDLALPGLKNPFELVMEVHLARFGAGVDVPITIGRGR